MAAKVSSFVIPKVSLIYATSCFWRSFFVYQWNNGASYGTPHFSDGLSEFLMTIGYPFTTAHIDWLVSSVFSVGTVVTDGMKIRSTLCFTRFLIWPCTSFAGKHTVSDVTAESPSSYIFLVLLSEMRTVYPNACQKVFQNGMVSQ